MVDREIKSKINMMKQKHIVLYSLSLSCLTQFAGALSTKAGEVRVKNILPDLSKPINEIKNKTQVPIISPAKLNVPISQGKIYSEWFASEQHFSICVTNISRCNVLNIEGRILTKATLDGFQQYRKVFTEYPSASPCSPYSNPKINGSGYIALTGGIQGFFFEPFASKYCGHATITWRQGNYQYNVSKELGTLKELVDLANSVIENQP